MGTWLVLRAPSQSSLSHGVSYTYLVVAPLDVVIIEKLSRCALDSLKNERTVATAFSVHLN